jgi:UDP-glucose 4-epimerase
MSQVLVTGGAGYIGSHAVLALLEAGHEPIVLDNLVCGHREPIESLGVRVVVGETGDMPLLSKLFGQADIRAVMHFAGFAYVGESVQNPGKYYRNNVAATISLLDSMIRADIRQFIFSSSCATYGVPDGFPIDENTEQRPINPYGQSKLMVERILRDFDDAHGLRSVVFRYFNAAGADPGGRVGECHEPETHLIPLTLRAALDEGSPLTVFGDDYETPDGSCLRDYVHVSDLAEAHVLGLRYLEAGGRSEVFNLGSGRGSSVFEVIDAARSVTGCAIPIRIAPRRAGDPPVLYASADKAKRVLDWKPRYEDVKAMIAHAWNWERRDAAA